MKEKFIFLTNRPNEKEKQNIIEREKKSILQKNRLEMFTKKLRFLQTFFFLFFLIEYLEHLLSEIISLKVYYYKIVNTEMTYLQSYFIILLLSFKVIR